MSDKVTLTEVIDEITALLADQQTEPMEAFMPVLDDLMEA